MHIADREPEREFVGRVHFEVHFEILALYGRNFEVKILPTEVQRRRIGLWEPYEVGRGHVSLDGDRPCFHTLVHDEESVPILFDVFPRLPNPGTLANVHVRVLPHRGLHGAEYDTELGAAENEGVRGFPRGRQTLPMQSVPYTQEMNESRGSRREKAARDGCQEYIPK